MGGAIKRFGSFRYIWLVCLALSVAGIWAPHRARAQTVHWNERRTLQFSVLYPDGAEAQAEEYAQFVDTLYEEASSWWGYRTPTPVVLRIYPTMEAYIETNPLAAAVPGVIAHAHTGRREISIALPQTESQTPDEIRNNVRHELTHLIAADLSGGELSTMWQEGIAQNAELPTGELDRKMQIMTQVVANNQVIGWSALDEPGAAYSRPEISYPQTYTMVAFLLRRSGMAAFRAFTEATRTTNRFQNALQDAYKVSAGQLEREWLAQLPEFVNGGYRITVQPTFDLAPVQDQINRGQYAAAIAALTPMLASMQAANVVPALTEATALLERARQGEQALSLAVTARTALSNGEYGKAYTAAMEAQPILEQLGQHEQAATVASYAQLAERGSVAETQLSAAHQQLRTLRVGSATTTLHTAFATFNELGDNQRAAQARQALQMLRRGRQALALFFCTCALGLLLWNSWQRRAERRTAMPYL